MDHQLAVGPQCSTPGVENSSRAARHVGCILSP